MKLTVSDLRCQAQWLSKGIALPQFDHAAMVEKTLQAPAWVHFGAGNIFRGFIAGLQQRLLNQGLADSGIIAAETFDFDIIDKIYTPYDAMTLMVSLKPDGSTDKEIIAAIAKGVKATRGEQADFALLESAFANPSLQMASYTITEKGYALTNMNGELLPAAAADMQEGPKAARHAMAITAALMLHRYENGAHPIALVSMDNCSANGDKLKNSVLQIARAWVQNGHAPQAFVDYLNDGRRVSFPWSMIDKITPRPADVIQKQLEDLGVEAMAPVVTSRNTYIAPFVNAEVPQYLVVEDDFPNGRPQLDKAGVYMTTRDTVNMTERMKVTTCLNPLHTALAVYGCLLGYESIAAEMQDRELKELVMQVGYKEGLPVVPDPKILSPKAFIDEVITQRFPNPFLPDTPQRIATDTSQKIPVRFGETLKSYLKSDTLDVHSLTAIPLVLAGWLRYLLAVDDKGGAMTLSSDPLLESLQSAMRDIQFGRPETVGAALRPILSNKTVFGVDLAEIGLADKVETLFKELMAAPGAVRRTLQKHLG